MHQPCFYITATPSTIQLLYPPTPIIKDHFFMILTCAQIHIQTCVCNPEFIQSCTCVQDCTSRMSHCAQAYQSLSKTKFVLWMGFDYSNLYFSSIPFLLANSSKIKEESTFLNFCYFLILLPERLA